VSKFNLKESRRH